MQYKIDAQPVELLLDVIPGTVVDAFAKGDILPVVLISILFGYVLSHLGEHARPVRDVIDAGAHLVFGAINVIMKLAPIAEIPIPDIERLLPERRHAL